MSQDSDTPRCITTATLSQISSQSATSSESDSGSVFLVTESSLPTTMSISDDSVNSCYPDASTDTYGVGGVQFLYKTGPSWPQPLHGTHPFRREIRPVAFNHPIRQKWREIIESIVSYGCSKDVDLPPNVIAGLAFGNQGEVETFCELVVVIGLTTGNIDFKRLQGAAQHVQQSILSKAGFPSIAVAICEWNSMNASSHCQLPSLGQPEMFVGNFEDLCNFFTSNPGLPISPLSDLHYSGTLGAYFNLPASQPGEKAHVLGLTCCHVAAPSHATTGLTVDDAATGPELIIAPGNWAYQRGIAALKNRINILQDEIRRYKPKLNDLQSKLELEGTNSNSRFPKQIERIQSMITGLSAAVGQLEDQHHWVTENLNEDLKDRSIGHVYFAERIGPSEESSGFPFTVDWAFVKIDEDAFSPNFTGNEVFVGSKYEFCRFICQVADPQESHDHCKYPEGGLLRISDYVPEAEMLADNPNLETVNNTGNSAHRMPVFKNGMATGVTFGFLNGLESYVRRVAIEGIPTIEFSSMEATIIAAYGDRSKPFSAQGDSGSSILDGTGRFLGLLTGGNAGSHDVTFATPAYRLIPRIMEYFPGISLLPAGHDTQKTV